MDRKHHPAARHRVSILSRFMERAFTLRGPWQTPVLRLLSNLVPAFRATGGRVTFMSPDGHEMRIRLKKRIRNINVHGAIYGGSIYSAVAGIPGAMLIRLLGPRYFVALKSSTVHFHKPSKTTIHATIRIHSTELEEITRALAHTASLERVFPVKLHDDNGSLCCTVENTMHIARRRKAT